MENSKENKESFVAPSMGVDVQQLDQTKYKGFCDIDTAHNELELWAQWYATHGRNDDEFVSERNIPYSEATEQLKLVHVIDDLSDEILLLIKRKLKENKK